MACMIWQAMFGNGVLIGMALIIIANHPHVILKDRVRAVTVFCGAVLGTTILEIPVGFSTYVWLTATTAFPRLPSTSTTSVFVVCQDFLLHSSGIALVLVEHGPYCVTIVWLL